MAKKKKTQPVEIPELTVTSALRFRETQLKELSLRTQLIQAQKDIKDLQTMYAEVKQDLGELYRKYTREGYDINPDSLKYVKKPVETPNA